MKKRVDDNEEVDMEYHDHDIDITGKVKKRQLKKVNRVLIISLSVAAIGIVLFLFFGDSSITLWRSLGVTLLVLGFMGVLICPLFGTNR